MIAAQVKSGGYAVMKNGSSGVIFALNNTQGGCNWILSKSTGLTYQFVSGSTATPIVHKTWYQLQLKVTSKEIFASIDGALVTHIPLFNSTNGRVAIGSSWDYMQFDDLIITSPFDMDEGH